MTDTHSENQNIFKETFFSTQDSYAPWSDEYLHEVDVLLSARETKGKEDSQKRAPSPDYWAEFNDIDVHLLCEAADEAERAHLLKQQDSILCFEPVSARSLR